jgi:hypothetical protein
MTRLAAPGASVLPAGADATGLPCSFGRVTGRVDFSRIVSGPPASPRARRSRITPRLGGALGGSWRWAGLRRSWARRARVSSGRGSEPSSETWQEGRKRRWAVNEVAPLSRRRRAANWTLAVSARWSVVGPARLCCGRLARLSARSTAEGAPPGDGVRCRPQMGSVVHILEVPVSAGFLECVLPNRKVNHAHSDA